MNTENFERWMERPLSWSQISSFEYSPEQWYKNYFLRERDPETAEMKFGKLIGERVANDPTFLPELARLDKAEHEFRVVFGGIPLVGYADFFCTETRRKIDELKTGVKPWTQKRADEHGQITMYHMMHFITEKIKPEEIDSRLIWLPTERIEGGDFNVDIKLVEPIVPQIFHTKRTMRDVLEFGSRIKARYVEMEEYIKNK